MERQPSLEVELGHRLGRLTLDVGLRVGAETLALVGPSGAGKSSILRGIAGLLVPQRGRIVADGRTLYDTERRIDVPPNERGVGLVFQDGALFPHLSVAHNVAYGLRARGVGRADAAQRATRALERFGLTHLAGAKPTSLSGGERQRVALLRAVATDPRILLLDEPLSSLDTATKADVSMELAARLGALRLPTILVSHDVGDVLGLASRVAVLEQGHVIQEGTPAELLATPASAFVASFAGVNYIPGLATRRDGLTVVAGEGQTTFFSTDSLEGPVGMIVYPWDVAISAERPEGSALNAIAGPVSRVSPLGNRTRVAITGSPPIVAEVTEESARRLRLSPGVVVVASWKATGTRLVPRSPGNGELGSERGGAAGVGATPG